MGGPEKTETRKSFHSAQTRVGTILPASGGVCVRVLLLSGWLPVTGYRAGVLGSIFFLTSQQ